MRGSAGSRKDGRGNERKEKRGGGTKAPPLLCRVGAIDEDAAVVVYHTAAVSLFRTASTTHRGRLRLRSQRPSCLLVHRPVSQTTPLKSRLSLRRSSSLLNFLPNAPVAPPRPRGVKTSRRCCCCQATRPHRVLPLSRSFLRRYSPRLTRRCHSMIY